MDIAYFAQHDDLRRHANWEKDHVSIFNHFDGFLAADYSPSAFVIGFKDGVLATGLLSKLRSMRNNYHKPMFLEFDTVGESALLADGVANSVFQTQKKARAILARTESIADRVQTNEADLRLLHYLVVREHPTLTPLQNTLHAEAYSYPMADVFCRDHTSTKAWLEHLCDQGLLRRGKLIDRFLCCSHCRSSRLLFSDICPKCQSIDVIESRKKMDFSKQEDLFPGYSLKHKHALLHQEHPHHHIDRVLDCEECGFQFQEPEVVAKCMHCQTISMPDELVSKSVYQLEITTVGYDYIGVHPGSQTRQRVRKRIKTTT
jgi:hypothetical protein